MKQEKTFNQKEIERLKFILKQLEEDGLKVYEYNKPLVIEYVKKSIQREIKEFQEKEN